MHENTILRSEQIDLSQQQLQPLASLILRDKLQGLLTGIALGDSLGLPVETFSREAIAQKFGSVADFMSLEINDYFRGSNLPEGSCSDDTQLTIALFKSFIQAKGYSLAQVCNDFIDAYQESTLGWGDTTRKGAQALKEGYLPGSEQFMSQLGAGLGNGIPMKVAALAAWGAVQGLNAADMFIPVKEVSSLTHANNLSVSAGLAQVAALTYCLQSSRECFNAEEFIKVVYQASEIGRHAFAVDSTAEFNLSERLLLLKDYQNLSTEKLITLFNGGGCFVYDSLPFSYAFFLRDPFSFNCVFEAINAGGDTDSNGAIVGALSGALLGHAHFPQGLVAKVQDIAKVRSVAEQFANAFNL